MPIKMIAMDIDGTLLNTRTELPRENCEAIAEAAARGIEIVLVTGRRFDFARPIADQITPDLHLIVNNGALIKSKTGETYLRHLLPREVARRVLLATRDYRAGAAVVFDRPRERQVISEQIDWDDPARRGYYNRNRQFLSTMVPLEKCLDENEDPIQVMFTGPVAPLRAVMEILRSLPFAREFSRAVAEYEAKDFSILDVIRAGISKGVTLKEWARRRGIEREAVMAIGDNCNDREMLEFAGLPVVMGNGVPELKDRGWAVTLSNDEAGVAQAIRTFVLARNGCGAS
jgi:Cof subfamily protein (haloacid dehalogenase superfamily)